MAELARRWVWVLLLSAAGCSVVSEPRAVMRDDAGPDGAAADGGDASAPAQQEDASSDTGTGSEPAREACDVSQALRCASGRQRERCQDGFWTPTVECGEAEVCASGAGGEVRCLGVASVCRGSAGAVVCDGKGVMYHCGGDGVIEASEACPSARHCQLGIAAKSCAACLPGELRCSGDKLERCDADGRAFSTQQSCAADSCDAKGGRCRGEPCAETRWLCRGDQLQTCKQGEMEFRDAERCGAGLCDASAGACDVCLPGQATCDGDSALRCSADGKRQERVDCAADGGHCVGAGRCVRCENDDDCDDPGACKRAYCNLASGTCEPQLRAAGSSCPAGVCAASGECVACLRDGDCAAPGECKLRHCDSASGSCKPQPAAKGASCGAGKCDGAGECVACMADSDCPEVPVCQVRHCDTKSGTCQPTNSPRTTKCAAGVCDGSGKCAGCNGDADCPAPGACQTRHCDTSTRTCDPQPQADGSACTGAFGAGSCSSGRCVQCINNQSCRSSVACDEGYCRSSDNSCQTRPKAVGVDCGSGNVCDGASRCVECTTNLHCGDNASCLSNACHCNAGFVANPSGEGCNFDECAKFDDNRCGVSDGGNTCSNTVGGYDCGCVAPWRSGSGQCFQTGTRTVPNGASWSVVPEFTLVCENVFAQMANCPNKGQLTWVTLCGLPDTTPATCSAIEGLQDGLAVVSLRKVDYGGPLEQYGNPPADGFVSKVENLQPGNVILVQSLASLYVMRLTAVSAAGLAYDWAMIWRDTCWRPGGPRCAASCSCPGGN